jgi:hypothetical protein
MQASRWRAICLCGLGAVLVTLASAQDPEAFSDGGPRDLNGVWFGIGNNDPDNATIRPIEGGERPFTARGLEIYRHRQAAAAAAKPIRQPADECLPHGVPAVARLPTPLQIIETPGQVTIIHEASRTVRMVYMDEPQSPSSAPTFMGHSVGHWDGDTLVIDTIALRPNWLDITGAPASEQMHVIERLRKIDGGKRLENVFTIADPKMYTQPWTARREYLWYPGERVEEYICEESERTEPGVRRLDYRDIEN